MSLIVGSFLSLFDVFGLAAINAFVYICFGFLKVSRVVPDSTISPLYITIVLSAISEINARS